MIFNAIEKRWTDSFIDAIKNAKFVSGCELIKVGIRGIDEETLSIIWHDMLYGLNELMRLNAMARMKNEMPDTEALLNIAIQKIESGDVFKKTTHQKNLEKKRDSTKKDSEK